MPEPADAAPRSAPPSDPPPASPARHDPYGPWRNPDFRLYAVSWFLIVFAKHVETVTVQLYVYGETGDPLALGWIGLAQALPVMALSIAGGQLADRFDRRRVMSLMYAVSSLVAVGLWMSAREGSVALIYMLLAVDASTQALGGPSRAAILPQIVGPARLSTAITWSSSIFQIATMTGPAAGGMILGWVSLGIFDDLGGPSGSKYNTSLAFLVVIFSRMAAATFVALVRTRRTAGAPDAVSWQSLVAGIRFVWRTKAILATITLDMFAVLFGGFTYLLPIYAEDILGVGASGLGFLRSAEAVGAVTMAMVLAHLPPMKRSGRTLLWAVAGFGAATIAFALSRSYALSLVLIFVIGALDNISVVIRHTLVQLLTPDAMRGRVSAVNTVFIVASNDIGGLESGVTAKLFGPVASVVIGGVGAIGVVIAAALKWPELRRLGALSDVRPPIEDRVLEETEAEQAARG
ncbi:MAG: MFS transporter [Planctomycetota bacterium]